MNPEQAPTAIHIRISPGALRLAEQAAMREGLSVAGFVRRLLMLELERLQDEGRLSREETIQ